MDVDLKLPESVDVCIVGAGPAGLLSMFLLTAVGTKNVIIVDHSKIHYPNNVEDYDSLAGLLPSQSIFLNSQTLDILHRLGLLEEIAALARPIQGGKIVLNDKIIKDIERFPKASATGFQSGIIVEQWKLERLLCNKMKGGQIFRFYAAMKLVVCQDSEDYPVCLMVRRYSATTRQWTEPNRWVRAKYLLGCDGYLSFVKRALGFDSVPLSPPEEYLCVDIVVDNLLAAVSPEGVTMEETIGTKSNQYTVVHQSKGSALLYPYSQSSSYRLIMRRPVSSKDEEGCSKFGRVGVPNESQITQIVRVISPRSKLKAINWKMAYRIGYSYCEKVVSKQRCILLGDSMRSAPPFWCCGINAAIQDSYALYWRIYLLLNGYGGSDLLDTYESERVNYTKHAFDRFINGSDNILNYAHVLGTSTNSFAKLLKRGSKAAVPEMETCMREIVCPSIARTPSRVDTGDDVGAGRIITYHCNDESSTRIGSVMDLCSELHQHILLMIVRVNPTGMRVRTIFGCQRQELAERYSLRDVETLVSIASTVGTGSLSCGTVGTGSLPNCGRPTCVAWLFSRSTEAVCQEQLPLASRLVLEIPSALKSMASAQNKDESVAGIDHEGDVVRRLGLKVSLDAQAPILPFGKKACQREDEAPGAIAGDCSTAFALIRPDGVVAAKGLANDASSVRNLESYVASYLTKPVLQCP